MKLRGITLTSWAALALAAPLLSGCGSPGLSDADSQACDAAERKDARGVFALQSVIDDEQLKRNADRIKIGTSDADDREAMEAMLAVCIDKGFQADDN